MSVKRCDESERTYAPSRRRERPISELQCGKAAFGVPAELGDYGWDPILTAAAPNVLRLPFGNRDGSYGLGAADFASVANINQSISQSERHRLGWLRGLLAA